MKISQLGKNEQRDQDTHWNIIKKTNICIMEFSKSVFWKRDTVYRIRHKMMNENFIHWKKPNQIPPSKVSDTLFVEANMDNPTAHQLVNG